MCKIKGSELFSSMMIPQMTAVADLTCSAPEKLREIGVDVCKSFVIQHHVSCTKPQCLKYNKSIAHSLPCKTNSVEFACPTHSNSVCPPPQVGGGGVVGC